MKLTLDDLAERIKAKTHLEFDGKELTIHYQDQVIPIPLSEEETKFDDYVLSVGDLVRYSIEGNDIDVHMEIVIHGKDVYYPIAVVDLTADIQYITTDERFPEFIFEDVLISYTEE